MGCCYGNKDAEATAKAVPKKRASSQRCSRGVQPGTVVHARCSTVRSGVSRASQPSETRSYRSDFQNAEAAPSCARSCSGSESALSDRVCDQTSIGGCSAERVHEQPRRSCAGQLNGADTVRDTVVFQSELAQCLPAALAFEESQEKPATLLGYSLSQITSQKLACSDRVSERHSIRRSYRHAASECEASRLSRGGSSLEQELESDQLKDTVMQESLSQRLIPETISSMPLEEEVEAAYSSDGQASSRHVVRWSEPQEAIEIAYESDASCRRSFVPESRHAASAPLLGEDVPNAGGRDSPQGQDIVRNQLQTKAARSAPTRRRVQESHEAKAFHSAPNQRRTAEPVETKPTPVARNVSVASASTNANGSRAATPSSRMKAKGTLPSTAKEPQAVSMDGIQSLLKSKRAQVLDWFQPADGNNNGAIHRKEFVTGLDTLGFGLRRADTERFFQLLDKKEKGTIAFYELEHALQGTSSRDTRSARSSRSNDSRSAQSTARTSADRTRSPKTKAHSGDGDSAAEMLTPLKTDARIYRSPSQKAKQMSWDPFVTEAAKVGKVPTDPSALSAARGSGHTIAQKVCSKRAAPDDVGRGSQKHRPTSVRDVSAPARVGDASEPSAPRRTYANIASIQQSKHPGEKPDTDMNFPISREAFVDALKLLGLNISKVEANALFSSFDKYGSGYIEFRELERVLRYTAVGGPLPKMYVSPRRYFDLPEEALLPLMTLLAAPLDARPEWTLRRDDPFNIKLKRESENDAAAWEAAKQAAQRIRMSPRAAPSRSSSPPGGDRPSVSTRPHDADSRPRSSSPVRTKASHPHWSEGEPSRSASPRRAPHGSEVRDRKWSPKRTSSQPHPDADRLLGAVMVQALLEAKRDPSGKLTAFKRLLAAQDELQRVVTKVQAIRRGHVTRRQIDHDKLTALAGTFQAVGGADAGTPSTTATYGSFAEPSPASTPSTLRKSPVAGAGGRGQQRKGMASPSPARRCLAEPPSPRLPVTPRSQVVPSPRMGGVTSDSPMDGAKVARSASSPRAAAGRETAAASASDDESRTSPRAAARNAAPKITRNALLRIRECLRRAAAKPPRTRLLQRLKPREGIAVDVDLAEFRLLVRKYLFVSPHKFSDDILEAAFHDMAGGEQDETTLQEVARYLGISSADLDSSVPSESKSFVRKAQVEGLGRLANSDTLYPRTPSSDLTKAKPRVPTQTESELTHLQLGKALPGAMARMHAVAATSPQPALRDLSPRSGRRHPGGEADLFAVARAQARLQRVEESLALSPLTLSAVPQSQAPAQHEEEWNHRVDKVSQHVRLLREAALCELAVGDRRRR
eukprot:TRINITY_DN22600_c0_g5_i1.p1 TRINITY_DN22600_c0_g5~~TRINITY_DN22600_c0_g5_i1.p1  ORF type:complete len:1321 (+),score=158.75 TRINITY_DN22600_c0_g5_i1:88-4050(+)